MTRPLVELELLLAELECHKHWTIRTRNRAGDRSGYECTIWGHGKRVTAGSTISPERAIRAALDKLKNPPPKRVEGRPRFGIVG